MITQHETLGAPVTDMEEYIVGPRTTCRSDADPPVEPGPDPTPRRDRWIRWATIPVATLVLVAAWAMGRSASPAPMVPPPGAGTPAGMEGFAEFYVATYLTGPGPEGEALRPFLLGVDGIDALRPHDRYVPRAAALGANELGDGYWSVTVAAEVLYRNGGGYGPGGAEFYEVGVAAVGDEFLATGAPMPVPAPVATLPHGVYSELRTKADAATAAFMADFLTAYLVDGRRLARFVTPESGIAAFESSPAADVEVRFVRVGEVGGATWVTAAAVLTDSRGVTLPTSVTARFVSAADGVRIAELLPGPPPFPASAS